MTPAQHALQPAGVQAALIADLWWLTIAICAAVFVAVLVALFVALRRAPRGDEDSPPDLAPLQAAEPGPRRAVAASVAVTVVLLLVLLGASAMTDRALQRMPLEGALQLEVIANQWWWDVRYDDPHPSRKFATANELVVPVGRPVIARLKATDVIHSFWVPNLHGKKDLIPGMETTIHFRADQPGIYRGQCAEFCGLQHAYMAFVVKAVSEPEFERWAEAQRAPAAEPGDERARRGRELFLSGSCMLCHAIQGTTAQARKAPDLTHVAGRDTLAAGRLANTPENMKSWIADPQKLKPGVNMPAHPMAPQDLDALAAYLGGLR
jgi:cytochrome c oxidase subunit 2